MYKNAVKGLKLNEFKKIHHIVVVLAGKIYTSTRIYRNVPLRIKKVEFLCDLFTLEMDDLDVILSMNWLDLYDSKISCRNMKINMIGPK